MDRKHTQADIQKPKTPRTKPAEVRLDELMTAAEKLFLAKGVEATTINEIVAEAQVAKGTFYHYFSSKNDMLEALGGRYTAQFLARLQEAVDACPADDWQARLRTWIHVSVQAYAQTYRTHDIVYTNHHHHDRSNPDKNAILKQLQDIIENGRQSGVWVSEQPRIVALLIYAGVHGATDEIIAAQTEDCTEFAQAVADSCMCMLDIVEPAKEKKRTSNSVPKKR